MSDLTPIQKEIASALEQLKEKSLITEAVLAKKVREKAKIQGKNKAGLQSHQNQPEYKWNPVEFTVFPEQRGVIPQREKENAADEKGHQIGHCERRKGIEILRHGFRADLIYNI